MKKSIYLDYAAATPMRPEVLKAMTPFFTQQFYNPSSTYLAGRAARRQLDEQRSKVAQLLGARPAEVIFTAGATEANNLAINGVMRQFADGEILVSAIEHQSVLAPAKQYNCRQIPVTKSGVVDLAKLEMMLTPKTKLVSVMLVNNELGTIQPIKEIAKILNRSSIWLHTDAAQAGNYLDLHTSRLGVDMMSLNGGKIYGPKQSGVLYIKAGTKIWPQIVGGGQEFGLRSGTENLAAAAGLAAALALAQAGRVKESERLSQLRDDFEKAVLQIKGARLNGAGPRAPHISSLSFDGVDNERLMMELDERGIQCAVGSACSASSDEPSRTLKAIGLTDNQARSTLRFSFGRQTSRAELNHTAETLAGLLDSNR